MYISTALEIISKSKIVSNCFYKKIIISLASYNT